MTCTKCFETPQQWKEWCQYCVLRIYEMFVLVSKKQEIRLSNVWLTREVTLSALSTSFTKKDISIIEDCCWGASAFKDDVISSRNTSASWDFSAFWNSFGFPCNWTSNSGILHVSRGAGSTPNDVTLVCRISVTVATVSIEYILVAAGIFRFENLPSGVTVSILLNGNRLVTSGICWCVLLSSGLYTVVSAVRWFTDFFLVIRAESTEEGRRADLLLGFVFLLLFCGMNPGANFLSRWCHCLCALFTARILESSWNLVALTEIWL